VKLKNICNFIAYSKKNQKEMDQMWMKKKLMALVWSFKRANTELEEERKNKKEKKIRRGDKEGKGKKNGRRRQTKDVSGTHIVSSHRRR